MRITMRMTVRVTVTMSSMPVTMAVAASWTVLMLLHYYYLYRLGFCDLQL